MNDKGIQKVLRTWYPKDHPLHYDLHHPLGKLVGEWGELLDDYMKHLYKPGYKWKPLGELVDIWYYIRILAYQTNTKVRATYFGSSKINYLISCAIEKSSGMFCRLILEDQIDHILPPALNYNYTILSKICELSNLTIDQLTEASWEKLKPGSERGEEWMKAREFNWSEFEEE